MKRRQLLALERSGPTVAPIYEVLEPWRRLSRR